MTNFNPLNFIADHAGMNLADAIQEAYEQGKKDAQTEPKTGKWIPKDDGRYHCSSCDDIAPKGYRWHFCPSCGARMKKGDEHD